MKKCEFLKAYDGTIVSVPTDKKEEWLKGQEQIKNLLSQGKTIDEVLKILKGSK